MGGPFFNLSVSTLWTVCMGWITFISWGVPVFIFLDYWRNIPYGGFSFWVLLEVTAHTEFFIYYLNPVFKFPCMCVIVFVIVMC
jgi:hypothetical protein